MDEAFETISSPDFESLIASIPQKWYDSLETLQIDNKKYFALPTILYFLRKLVKRNSSEIDTKINLFVDYFGKLLELQSNVDFLRDPLVTKSQTFAEQCIGNILQEFLDMAEKEWQDIGLRLALKRMMNIANSAAKQGKVYSRLCKGMLDACDNTIYPVIYLQTGCGWIASPEQMALLCEHSITRSMQLENNSFSWIGIQRSLKVPELDESTFIRNCLSHCLIYTLFAHALNRLETAVENDDFKTMIGEQIGVWIESLNLESIWKGSER